MAKWYETRLDSILGQAGVGAYCEADDSTLKWDRTYFDPDQSGTTTIDHGVNGLAAPIFTREAAAPSSRWDRSFSAGRRRIFP